MDYSAIGNALATRYGTTPTPAGYRALRLATASPGEDLPPTPCILVFAPESGSFDTGQGTRTGVHNWVVRLYYDQAGDLGRQAQALMKWAEQFADQLKGATQLGGIVTRATLDGYKIGFMDYAGKTYAGIEGSVKIVTAESWAATA